MNKPITKKEWEDLSGKGQWDVISALRGPDLDHSGQVKWFTTSVIRGKLREIMRVGGQVNEDLDLIVLPTMTKVHHVDFCTVHFIQHVQDAAVWLKIPVIKVPGSIFWTHYRSYELAARAFARENSRQDLIDHIQFLVVRGY